MLHKYVDRCDSPEFVCPVEDLGWFESVTFLVIGLSAPSFNCAARENVIPGRQLQMSALQFISYFPNSAGIFDF